MERTFRSGHGGHGGSGRARRWGRSRPWAAVYPVGFRRFMAFLIAAVIVGGVAVSAGRELGWGPGYAFIPGAGAPFRSPGITPEGWGPGPGEAAVSPGGGDVFDGMYAVARCEAPGLPDPGAHGTLTEEELPWAGDPPPAVAEFLSHVPGSRFVTAFRTSLPEPLFGEAYNISLAADLLAGTVLQPGEVFSMNASLGPYTEARGYRAGPSYMGGRITPSSGGGVCKISSTLYNLAIHAGLQIVERHAHSMLVPYVPPGRDATVAYGVLDFKFKNDTDDPIIVWSVSYEGTLYMALYGRLEAPAVEWGHEELGRRPTSVQRIPNGDLSPGEERVISEGFDGITVRTWVTVTRPGGEPEQLNLGTDHYVPMPRVVEYGP